MIDSYTNASKTLRKIVSMFKEEPVMREVTFEGGAKRIMEDKGCFDLLPEAQIADIYQTKHLISIDPKHFQPEEATEEELTYEITQLLYSFSVKDYENHVNVAETYNSLRLLVLYISYAQYNTEPGDDYVSKMVKQLAIHVQKGAEKYGERNCEKGIPFWSFIDSGRRHTTQWLLHETDENHAISAIWNFLYAMWTIDNSQSTQSL